MRMLQAGLNFYVMKDENQIIGSFLELNSEQTQILLVVLVIILDLMLTDILPFLLALRQSTVNLLTGQDHRKTSEVILRPQYPNVDSSLNERRLITFTIGEV